jgi:hypothetical protein
MLRWVLRPPQYIKDPFHQHCKLLQAINRSKYHLLALLLNHGIDRRFCCCFFNFILLSHALHTYREIDHWVAVVFRIYVARWVLTKLNPVPSVPNQPANIVFVRDFMEQCVVGRVRSLYGTWSRVSRNKPSFWRLIGEQGIAVLAVGLTTHAHSVK